LVCDATFYGKRKDKLGTLVFKDSLTNEIVVWKNIQSELVKDYKQLLTSLVELGYTVLAVTVDGKRGLYKVFENYPWKFHKHSSTHFTFSLPLISQTAFHSFHFSPSTF